jgi:dipeptidyl aminopeptidase/acylaminoacyl peptidase
MNKILLFFLVFLCMKTSAQKKELDHTVYDSWQSIRETSLHPQGKYIVYAIVPQEGDGTIIIRNVKTGNELSIARATQAVFTENGEYLVAKIKPSFVETRKAKIDKKKADEMPKDSLVIVELATSAIQKIPSVKSFQLAEHGNDMMVYLKDKKGDINKEGSDLVMRDLSSAKEKTYSNISQYLIHPKAMGVVMYQVKTKQKESQILLATIADTNTKVLTKQVYTATNFIWDEEGKQLAYLVEKDSADKALQKNYYLAYYTPSLETAVSIFDKSNNAIPASYTIGGDRKMKFSKSGNKLEFGIQPILPLKDTSLPEFERVSVDIWHYNDPIIQPAQLKALESTLKSTELVIINTQNKNASYLGKIRDRDLMITAEGDGAIAYATIDSSYLLASQWQGFSLKEIYVIQTNNGERKLIQKQWKGNLLSPSYDGNYLVYYDEPQKKYFAYNAATGKTIQIAKDIKTSLFDEENDMPDDPNAYGIAKWMDNNQEVLMYDKYDIWLVDVNGIKASKKLTNGRINKIISRFVETDTERKTLAKNATILIKGYSEVDKSELISTLNLADGALNLINQVPMHFTTIVGASHSNDIAVMQEDEVKSPNLYLYTLAATKQNPTSIATINTQQANYNWMSSQIVKWKAYTGKMAEGVLYLPENFDAKKKYPMIVYFYERSNQTLHNYLAPAPTPSRLNIPFFASRGYIVFVPDIWYTRGYPGQSAYDYILSGTRAMIQKGFVDSTKVGLQGQSWGGYQIAYLITKTNLYAAAWAGAPVVNMTSAYSGIRWGPGISRQFQYEKSQTRLGASLWERPDLYIKNSPLFSLPNIKTPLVIMSNDADDAVPWYQGIEMYSDMKRLNKKVWLLVYNNEAHNLVERKNRKDIQIREQQFFDSYLKGAPMPEWLSKGVPAVMKGRTWGLNY